MYALTYWATPSVSEQMMTSSSISSPEESICKEAFEKAKGKLA